MKREYASPRMPFIAALFLAILAVAWIGLGAGAARGGPPGNGSLLANVGTGFTYQGFLEDSGSPVNDDCDFQFSLWDMASGGTQIGVTQTETAVPVTNGRFTVLLNDTEQYGSNGLIGQARWLRIAVRCPAGAGGYTTLSPRQELTGAPYAHSLRPGAVISGTVLGNPNPALLTLRSDNVGLWLETAGSGVYVGSAGEFGVAVESAAQDGLRVNSAGWDGLRVASAGGHGVNVESAGLDGVHVGSMPQNGVLVESAGSDGVAVQSAGAAGFAVGSATGNGVWVGTVGATGFGVESAGLDGVRVGSVVQDGVHVQSAGLDGVEVVSATLYAGYFNGPIYTTSCTGCLLAAFGVNSSDSDLAPGDIVAIQGVSPSNFEAAPMLLNVGLAWPGQAVIGVVQGRAEAFSDNTPAGGTRQRLVPRPGAVQPGEYATIIIYGPVQVKASVAGGPITLGARLTVDAAGRARALQTVDVGGVRVAESAPTLGVALEAATADGLIWVLVNPH